MSDQNVYQASKIISISADQAGQRIDNFLFTYLKTIPKTRIYKMLRKGEVRVNKGRIKPVYRLQAGDQVRLPPLHKSPDKQVVNAGLSVIQNLQTRIIYEDERVLVLNKPSGMAVHGGSGESFGVIEALRALRPDAHYLELVHRLDKLTSGCLLIAKKRSCLRFLHEQLREHSLQKTYHALVWGNWPESLRQIDTSLEVQKIKDDRRTVASDKGKDSLTRFRLLKSFKDFSLIEAQPVTGRMHQIRVHCAQAGYPICGDSKYLLDKERLIQHQRLFLHAASIKFRIRPDSPAIECQANSSSFTDYLNGLK